MKKMSQKEKFQHNIKLQHELTEMYELVNMMFIICIDKGLRLIMENPYSEEHYLRRYWSYSPLIIDRDRRERGDYFAKPTQFWFLNCEPQNNLLWEVENWNANSIGVKDAIRLMTKKNIKEHIGKDVSVKTARSMIHPDYANRFIREFILDME